MSKYSVYYHNDSINSFRLFCYYDGFIARFESYAELHSYVASNFGISCKIRVQS
jgi:hypothetical protein